MNSGEAQGSYQAPRAALRQYRSRDLAGLDLSLALVSQGSPERLSAEQAITRKFERAYGAHLTHFLPNLLRLNVADELGAVAGIRTARDNSLFLEQYLDRPVEQAIAAAFMTPVDRDQVVEVGNLAAIVPGHAYTLFAVLATVLSRAGYRWVACTATPQVASMLETLHFSAQTICRADPALLNEGLDDWGSYYASRPRVMAGDVQLAAEQAAANPKIAKLIRRLRRPILQMASSLRSAG
jgi:hypothetical protein